MAPPYREDRDIAISQRLTVGLFPHHLRAELGECVALPEVYGIFRITNTMLQARATRDLSSSYGARANLLGARRFAARAGDWSRFQLLDARRPPRAPRDLSLLSGARANLLGQSIFSERAIACFRFQV